MSQRVLNFLKSYKSYKFSRPRNLLMVLKLLFFDFGKSISFTLLILPIVTLFHPYYTEKLRLIKNDIFLVDTNGKPTILYV